MGLFERIANSFVTTIHNSRSDTIGAMLVDLFTQAGKLRREIEENQEEFKKYTGWVINGARSSSGEGAKIIARRKQYLKELPSIIRTKQARLTQLEARIAQLQKQQQGHEQMVQA